VKRRPCCLTLLPRRPGQRARLAERGHAARMSSDYVSPVAPGRWPVGAGRAGTRAAGSREGIKTVAPTPAPPYDCAPAQAAPRPAPAHDATGASPPPTYMHPGPITSTFPLITFFRNPKKIPPNYLLPLLRLFFVSTPVRTKLALIVYPQALWRVNNYLLVNNNR
jgi:hypothetical protein